MLFTQRIGQTFHRLLTRGLPALARLALGHAHVFHHFLQLFERLFGLSHAALLHQLLDVVHHALQVILRHLHAIALLALRLVSPVTLILLGLFAAQLVEIFLSRAAQLIHQLGDFFFGGPILDRLIQAILRTAHPFKSIRQDTFFQLNGQPPHVFGQLVLGLITQIYACIDFQPVNDLAQPQGRGLGAERLFGAIRYGAKHLRHTGRTGLGPQQIAAHFDHCRRCWIKKAPSRQHQLRRWSGRLLFCRIQCGE